MTERAKHRGIWKGVGIIPGGKNKYKSLYQEEARVSEGG